MTRDNPQQKWSQELNQPSQKIPEKPVTKQTSTDSVKGAEKGKKWINDGSSGNIRKKWPENLKFHTLGQNPK